MCMCILSIVLYITCCTVGTSDVCTELYIQYMPVSGVPIRSPRCGTLLTVLVLSDGLYLRCTGYCVHPSPTLSDGLSVCANIWVLGTLLYLKHISINPCLVSHRLSGPPRASSSLPSTYPIVYTVQHTTVLYNTRAVDMYDMIFIHPLGTFGVTTTGLTQKFKLIDPDPTMYCGT